MLVIKEDPDNLALLSLYFDIELSEVSTFEAASHNVDTEYDLSEALLLLNYEIYKTIDRHGYIALEILDIVRQAPGTTVLEFYESEGRFSENLGYGASVLCSLLVAEAFVNINGGLYLSEDARTFLSELEKVTGDFYTPSTS